MKFQHVKDCRAAAWTQSHTDIVDKTSYARYVGKWCRV